MSIPLSPQECSAIGLDNVIRSIAAETHLPEARAALSDNLVWYDDLSTLQRQHLELQAYVQLCAAGDVPAIPEMQSLPQLLAGLRQEGLPFPVKGRRTLGLYFTTLKEMQRYGKADRVRNSPLAGAFAALQSVLDVEKAFRQLFNEDDDTIRDKASGELAHIRKQIQTLEKRRDRQLTLLLKKYEKYLHDSQPTVRNERLVLAITDNHYKKIGGIVHGRSASGQTIYVEPPALTTLYTQLEEIRNAERKEIYRLLVAFAATLREYGQPLLANWDILVLFDCLHAKYVWMQQYAAQPAICQAEMQLKLCQARHPALVDRLGFQDVVALDLELSSEQRWFLITGPNAGGKTVVLKTVAVNIALAQLGLPVLCAEGSQFPHISHLLLDIGDKQSLEDDLSTFSSHMRSIENIIARADKRSFVCLDELGTGTDPAAGTVLARAILERLIASECLGLANTHHGALKDFARDCAGIDNACMDFDLAQLQPNYHFMAGIPGSSFALEMSRRLRFPEDVIARAEELLGDRETQADTMIRDLQERLRKARESLTKAEIAKSQSAALEKLYQERLASVEDEKKEILAAAADEAGRILKGANAAIENTIRGIKESKAESGKVRQLRRHLNDERQRLDELRNQQDTTKAEAAPQPIFSPGERVRWKNMDQTGEVLALQGKNKVLVQFGQVKMKLPLSECEVLPETKRKRNSGGSAGRTDLPPTRLTADIRGLYSDEVDAALDQQISTAYANNQSYLIIIHGKGAGVLRQAVQIYLKRHAQVAEFRPGRAVEGGAGVTVVRLK
jgi:DNA mismatch repair protein MutS2